MHHARHHARHQARHHARHSVAHQALLPPTPGLHPDEATDAIVQGAVAARLPFAVVTLGGL